MNPREFNFNICILRINPKDFRTKRELCEEVQDVLRERKIAIVPLGAFITICIFTSAW